MLSHNEFDTEMEAIQDKVLNDYLNQDETDDFDEFVMKKALLKYRNYYEECRTYAKEKEMMDIL